MAADRLDMTQVEVVQYLSERLNHHLTSWDVDLYSQFLHYAKQYMAFWERARENMQQPTRQQQSLLRKLGWQTISPMNPDRLLDGPAQFYGLASPQLVRKFLPVYGISSRDQAVVVVPYYRSLTKIGGFTLMTPRQEVVVTPVGNRRAYWGESGFAGLQLLWRMQSDSLVISSMLSNVIQLQMRNFSSSQIPLPLLSWLPPASPTRQRQWSLMSGRQSILWEPAPTAAIVHQAILSDAQLSFAGPERRHTRGEKSRRWRSWIKHDPPHDIWTRIVQRSQPYPEALRNWARSATPEERQRLLKDAEHCEDDVSSVVRTALRVREQQTTSRRINVPICSGQVVSEKGHTVIIEKGYKWYSHDGHVRLPCIVRVTHIVAHPSGQKEYVGYLQTEDRKAPFHVPINQANMHWLREFGVLNGIFLESETYTNLFRNKRVDRFNPFVAACRFETPEVMAGLENIGWDGHGFQLRSAKIADGVFTQNPEFKLPEDAPGPRQSNCKLREEVKRALQREGPEMEITWAMAAALCAQITAPAVDLHACGICLTRRKHDPFLQALYNRFEIRKGPLQDWRHRWPRRLERLSQAVREDEHGFFVTRSGAQSAAAFAELISVRADEPDLQPRLVTHSADKIVLNYLRRFTEKKPTFLGTWSQWVDDTYHRMRATFDFVESPAIRRAKSRLTFR